VLAAAIVFTAIVGGGLLSGDEDAIFITSTVGTAVAALVGVLSIPGLFAAYGLFKRRTWGASRDTGSRRNERIERPLRHRTGRHLRRGR
jgi:hypothetical protein